MSDSLPILRGAARPGGTAAPATIEGHPELRQARLRGAYAHVPFCFHKCHYCDFYSFVDQESRGGAFVERLLAEAGAWRPLVREPLETLFVGGGTPTLLEPQRLADLLQGLRRILPWATDAEWTVEANPETVTPEVAACLAAAGVRRVSVGCQSFSPALLAALERWHRPESVAVAVERLRAAGIPSINLDLIFAIPGSSMESWGADLQHACRLRPDHLSCYGLVYEPGTPLRVKLERGDVARVDEDLEAEMYELTRRELAREGYGHYEISNWSRPGHECRHNLLYWEDADWLALGPSASGHAGRLRWKNVPRLGDWLAHGPWSPVVDLEERSEDGRVGERFMLGLRCLAGLPAAEVDSLLAATPRGGARRRVIEEAIQGGLLHWQAGRLALTPAGLLLADRVISDLL